MINIFLLIFKKKLDKITETHTNRIIYFQNLKNKVRNKLNLFLYKWVMLHGPTN